MTPHLPFRLEYLHPDGHWFMVTGDQDSSLQYLRGILSERRYRSPRLAARIVRDRDGKVMEELPASTDPEVGPVAGWATATQLIDAAVSALRRVGRVDPGGNYGPTPEQAARVKMALLFLTAETSEIP